MAEGCGWKEHVLVNQIEQFVGELDNKLTIKMTAREEKMQNHLAVMGRRWTGNSVTKDSVRPMR